METTVLDRLLALYPHAKKTTLREMVASKRVRLNGEPVKSLKQPITPQDKFEVTDAANAPTKPTILANGLQLVHMDSHILIVDKPTGLLTSTDSKEKRPTIVKILSEYFQNQNSKNQIHLIHRLDKDASGLLVLARTSDAYHALKEQFYEHTITRRYDVIVHGIPKKKSDKLENLLVEHPETGVMQVITDMKKGKLAILDYVTIQSDEKKKIAHLQCTLYTGRKHQIRVQLKTIGHPVLGDKIYGAPGADTEPPNRLALHASHLTFKHPGTHREVSFDSQMPGAFAHLFRS
jgi:23S rRNA pseudouridine1911/1915/1917 synthase